MRLVRQVWIVLVATGVVVVQASTPPIVVPTMPAPVVVAAPQQAAKPASSTSAVSPQPAPTTPAVTAAPTSTTTASATLPAAPQLAQGPASDVASTGDDEAIEGIDTVDVDEPQGNWLYKRIWWQRAQTQYEKNKAAMDVLMESRMVFFEKRTEWDKSLFDAFYIEVGVSRGILEELINNTIAEIGLDQKKDGSLNIEERELLSKVNQEKTSLEQLQKDINAINQLDAAIDEVIIVLSKQINAARGFEKQSWQNLKSIGQELSDEKAKEHYYGMVTFGQNINALTEYIQKPLLKYFEDLGSKAKEQIQKAQASLAALKEKGLDFKKKWQALEEKSEKDRENASADNARLTQKELDEKEDREEEERAKRAEAEKQQGLFARIVTSISHGLKVGWDYVVSGAQWLWQSTLGRFFGSASVDSATVAVKPSGLVTPVVSVVTPAAPVVQPAPAPAPVVTPATVAPAPAVTPKPVVPTSVPVQ